MTRVVITGAAGFIGSHLAEMLVRRGTSVVGVDNFDAFYARRVKERNLAWLRTEPAFEFHEFDVRETDRLASLLRGEDVVVHLAAKAGVRPSIQSPTSYVNTNVGGTASVIEAMSRQHCRRLVFGSSSSVYGDSTPAPFQEDAPALEPVSPYAASKRGCELLLTSAAPTYGLRVASLRFFTVYGPRQRPDLAIHSFVRAIASGQPITLYGDGTQGRDYTYCDDIVTGIAAAIDWTAATGSGLEHFNLGGDRVVVLTELITTIAAKLQMVPDTVWEPMKPGDVQVTSANIDKARRTLGFQPRTSLEDGIGHFVDWFRSIESI